MTTSRAHVCRTHEEASRMVNELIKLECGNDPDALDKYEIKVIPCRDAKTNNKEGKVIIAWPRGASPTASNMIAVVYDNAKATAEADRRGWLS